MHTKHTRARCVVWLGQRRRVTTRPATAKAAAGPAPAPPGDITTTCTLRCNNTPTARLEHASSTPRTRGPLTTQRRATAPTHALRSCLISHCSCTTRNVPSLHAAADQYLLNALHAVTPLVGRDGVHSTPTMGTQAGRVPACSRRPDFKYGAPRFRPEHRFPGSSASLSTPPCAPGPSHQISPASGSLSSCTDYGLRGLTSSGFSFLFLAIFYELGTVLQVQSSFSSSQRWD